ncbi:hypothetical protein CYMTET_24826, partial [Cymbomonas tetramitiformis]
MAPGCYQCTFVGLLLSAFATISTAHTTDVCWIWDSDVQGIQFFVATWNVDYSCDAYVKEDAAGNGIPCIAGEPGCLFCPLRAASKDKASSRLYEAVQFNPEEPANRHVAQKWTCRGFCANKYERDSIAYDGAKRETWYAFNVSIPCDSGRWDIDTPNHESFNVLEAPPHECTIASDTYSAFPAYPWVGDNTGVTYTHPVYTWDSACPAPAHQASRRDTERPAAKPTHVSDDNPFKLSADMKRRRAAEEDEICYRVRWGTGTANFQEQVLFPVTSFPAAHPKVNSDQYCGYISQDAGIPHDKVVEWPVPGDESTCSLLEGPVAFYGYDHPEASSANTGYELSDTVLVYFIVDTNNEVNMVQVLDQANDGSGGAIIQEFSISEEHAETVNFKLMDDEGDTTCIRDDPTCATYCKYSSNFDCYSLDTGTGQGSMYQRWDTCCTDGIVMGPIPITDFCFTFTLDRTDRIYAMKLLSYDTSVEPATVQYIDVDFSEARSGGFEVCGYTCADFCNEYTTCSECTTKGGSACGWCASTGSCYQLSLKDICTSTEQNGTDFAESSPSYLPSKPSSKPPSPALLRAQRLPAALHLLSPPPDADLPPLPPALRLLDARPILRSRRPGAAVDPNTTVVTSPDISRIFGGFNADPPGTTGAIELWLGVKEQCATDAPDLSSAAFTGQLSGAITTAYDPVSHVEVILRTVTLYKDNNALSVHYHVRDAAGRPQVMPELTPIPVHRTPLSRSCSGGGIRASAATWRMRQ